MLSIQAGKILPSTLLRKLGSHSRQNRLNRAFRELGRVVRTMFLLRYISEADFRRSIRAETTKVESYNDFLDWVGFGGPVLKSDDPVEQAKQVKYMDLVANVIMLHNVHDLTGILADMETEGWKLTRALIVGLSPNLREHIRRFGRYSDDEDVMAICGGSGAVAGRQHGSGGADLVLDGQGLTWKDSIYWSGTEYAPVPVGAWVFGTDGGLQSRSLKVNHWGIARKSSAPMPSATRLFSVRFGS